MSQAEPLTFGARATRYERQRGREWDPHRMTLDQCTPAQRRRLMRKERRAWAAYAAANPDYGDWDGPQPGDYGDHDERDYYDDDQDPHDLGYCVTPGCNCCDDDGAAEFERRFLGDLGNWKPSGLLPPSGPSQPEEPPS